MHDATTRDGRIRHGAAEVAARLRNGVARGARSYNVWAGYGTMSNRAVAGWLGVLVCATAIVLSIDSAASAPAWLVALLFVAVALTELFPMQVGRIRYVGSDFVLWVALATVSPTLSLLVATSGIVLDALVHRIPLRLALCNVSTFATIVAVGSLMLLAGREAGVVDPGGAGLPLAVVAVAAVTASLNLVLLGIGSPLMRSIPLREIFARHWVPILPWMTLTASLAAGTVHAYFTIGPGAVVVALLLHGSSQVLLKTIEREERQRGEVHLAFAARDRYLADALEAEARERRRVALELHDDALQNLLAARQDLADGRGEEADARVAAAVGQVRRLVTRQYEMRNGAGDLRSRLDELLDLLTAGRGFAYDLDVASAPGGTHDDLIVALTRELVVNAVKHSRGSRIGVAVARQGDEVVLEVTDDGAGFDLGAAAARLRGGHLGLAVVQDRLAALGGDLQVTRGADGGAALRAWFPAVIG